MSKFGPFERMGTRETQRRAWREAVAQAAEEYGARALRCRAAYAAATATDRMWAGAGNWSVHLHVQLIQDTDVQYAALAALDEARVVLRAALSAPKPWTRPAKADLGKWRAGLCHLGSMLAGHWGPLLAEVARETINARLRPLRRKRRAAQRRRR